MWVFLTLDHASRCIEHVLVTIAMIGRVALQEDDQKFIGGSRFLTIGSLTMDGFMIYYIDKFQVVFIYFKPIQQKRSNSKELQFPLCSEVKVLNNVAASITRTSYVFFLHWIPIENTNFHVAGRWHEYNLRQSSFFSFSCGGCKRYGNESLAFQVHVQLNNQVGYSCMSVQP